MPPKKKKENDQTTEIFEQSSPTQQPTQFIQVSQPLIQQTTNFLRPIQSRPKQPELQQRIQISQPLIQQITNIQGTP